MVGLRVLAAAALITCARADVGILYEVWHSSAASLMGEVAAKGGVQLTTETVIESNGKYTLNDVYLPYGINGDIWYGE